MTSRLCRSGLTIKQQHLDHAAHAAGLRRATKTTLGLHGRRAIRPRSGLPRGPRAAILPRRRLLARILAWLTVHLLLAGVLSRLTMRLLLPRVLAGGRLLPWVLPRRRLLAGILAGRRLLPGVLPMLAGGSLARVAAGSLAWVPAGSLAWVPAGRLAWVAARAGGTVAWLACRSIAVSSVRICAELLRLCSGPWVSVRTSMTCP